jgi:hypothetical protein
MNKKTVLTFSFSQAVRWNSTPKQSTQPASAQNVHNRTKLRDGSGRAQHVPSALSAVLLTMPTLVVACC